MDSFKICIYKTWNAGLVIFYATTMFFGASLIKNLHGSYRSVSETLTHLTSDTPPPCGVVDAVAFLIIVFIARKSRRGYPNLPSILDTILQDATQQFVLIFSAHFLSLLLLFIAPVGDRHHMSGPLISLWVFSEECPALTRDVSVAFRWYQNDLDTTKSRVNL